MGRGKGWKGGGKGCVPAGGGGGGGRLRIAKNELGQEQSCGLCDVFRRETNDHEEQKKMNKIGYK